MRALNLFLCCCITATASTALADIYNGDFEAGGDGWTVDAPAEWAVEFPTEGGNPGGHALIVAPPHNPGEACIRQVVACGEGEGSCSVTFQFGTWQEYRTTPASREFQIRLYVDDALIYEFMATDRFLWIERTVDIPCGVHELAFCFEINDDPQTWKGIYDNIATRCDDPIPVVQERRTSLKVRFR